MDGAGIAVLLGPDVEVEVAGAVVVEGDIGRFARAVRRVDETVSLRVRVKRDLAHDEHGQVLRRTGAAGDGVDDEGASAGADDLIVRAAQQTLAESEGVDIGAALTGELERDALIRRGDRLRAHLRRGVVLRGIELLGAVSGRRGDCDAEVAWLARLADPVVQEVPALIPSVSGRLAAVILDDIGRDVQLEGEHQQHDAHAETDGELKALHARGLILRVGAVIVLVINAEQEGGFQTDLGVELKLQQLHADARADLKTEGRGDLDALPVDLVADVDDARNIADRGLVADDRLVILHRAQADDDLFIKLHVLLLFQHDLRVALAVGGQEAGDVIAARRGAVALQDLDGDLALEAEVERLEVRRKLPARRRVEGGFGVGVGAVSILIVVSARTVDRVSRLLALAQQAVLQLAEQIIAAVEELRLGFGFGLEALGVPEIGIAALNARIVALIRQGVKRRLVDDCVARAGGVDIGELDALALVIAALGVEISFVLLHGLADDAEAGRRLDAGGELHVEVDDRADGQTALHADGELRGAGDGHALEIEAVVQRVILEHKRDGHRELHAYALGAEVGAVRLVAAGFGGFIGIARLAVIVVSAEVAAVEEVLELGPGLLVGVADALLAVVLIDLAEGHADGKADLVAVHDDGNGVRHGDLRAAEVDAEVHVELAHLAAGLVHVDIRLAAFVLRVLDFLQIGGVRRRGDAAEGNAVGLHVIVAVSAGSDIRYDRAGIGGDLRLTDGAVLLLRHEGEGGAAGEGAEIVVHLVAVGGVGVAELAVFQLVAARDLRHARDGVFDGDGRRRGVRIEQRALKLGRPRIVRVLRALILELRRLPVAAERDIHGGLLRRLRHIHRVVVGGVIVSAVFRIACHTADEVAVLALLGRGLRISRRVRVQRGDEGGHDLRTVGVLVRALRNGEAARDHRVADLQEILAVNARGVLLRREQGLVEFARIDVAVKLVAGAIEDEVALLIEVAVDLSVAVPVPVNTDPRDGGLHRVQRVLVVFMVIVDGHLARKIALAQIDPRVAGVSAAVHEQQVLIGEPELDPLDVRRAEGKRRAAGAQTVLAQGALAERGGVILRVEGAVAVSNIGARAGDKAVVAVLTVTGQNGVDVIQHRAGAVARERGSQLDLDRGRAGIDDAELILRRKVVRRQAAAAADELDGRLVFRFVDVLEELVELRPARAAVRALVHDDVGEIVACGGFACREADLGADVEGVAALHAAVHELHQRLEAGVVAEDRAAVRGGVLVVRGGDLHLEGAVRKGPARQGEVVDGEHGLIVEVVVFVLAVTVVFGIFHLDLDGNARRAEREAAGVVRGEGVIIVAPVVARADMPVLVQRTGAGALGVLRRLQERAALNNLEIGLGIGIVIMEAVQIGGVVRRVRADRSLELAEHLTDIAGLGGADGGVVPAGKGGAGLVLARERDAARKRIFAAAAELAGRLALAVQTGLAPVADAPPALVHREVDRVRPDIGARILEHDGRDIAAVDLRGHPFGIFIAQLGVNGLVFRDLLRLAAHDRLAGAGGGRRARALAHGAGEVHGVRVVEAGRGVLARTGAGIREVHGGADDIQRAAVVALKLAQFNIEADRILARFAVVDELHAHGQLVDAAVKEQRALGIGVIRAGNGGVVRGRVFDGHGAARATDAADHHGGIALRLVRLHELRGEAQRARFGIVRVLDAQQQRGRGIEHLAAVAADDGEGRRLRSLGERIGERVDVELLDPLAVREHELKEPRAVGVLALGAQRQRGVDRLGGKVDVLRHRLKLLLRRADIFRAAQRVRAVAHTVHGVNTAIIVALAERLGVRGQGRGIRAVQIAPDAAVFADLPCVALRIFHVHGEHPAVLALGGGNGGVGLLRIGLLADGLILCRRLRLLHAHDRVRGADGEVIDRVSVLVLRHGGLIFNVSRGAPGGAAETVDLDHAGLALFHGETGLFKGKRAVWEGLLPALARRGDVSVAVGEGDLLLRLRSRFRTLHHIGEGVAGRFKKHQERESKAQKLAQGTLHLVHVSMFLLAAQNLTP